MATPNDEIASQASQERQASDIAAQKMGQYVPLTMPESNKLPPSTINPFKSSGV